MNAEVGPRGAVIVFGASRGLGRATAIAAAEEGFPVVLGCRRAVDGDVIVQQLRARGRRSMVVEVDVTDYPAVVAAVARAHEFGNGVAGLVNNAGSIGPLADMQQTIASDWARTIEVNLVGAYNSIRAGLPLLAPDGVIVNLSSGAAHTAVQGWSAYCASKAGLAMLTRCVFAEHGHRLRVYGAQPGMIDTDMQAEIRAAGVGPPSLVPRRSLLPASVSARAIAWLLKHAPADLSGTEVDLGAVALQLRMGRQSGEDKIDKTDKT